MIDSRTTRFVAASVLSACTILASTTTFGQTRPATTNPAGGPAIATPPTPLPPRDPNEPIAKINGVAIDNRKFNDLLMEVAGLRVFEEVRDWTLVQRACLDAGVNMDDASFQPKVQAEIDRVVNEIKTNMEKQNPGVTITLDMARQQLANSLQQKGMTGIEFRIAMQQSAGLRMLSDGKVGDPSPKELDDAVESQYGDRADIHIFFLRNMDQAADVRKGITDKKPPEVVAQQAAVGLRQARIAKNATQAKELQELVFGAHALHEGELSAAQPVEGGQIVMVLLDKRVAREPGKINDPTVRKEVEQQFKDFKVQQWMNTRLNDLRSRANIEVMDPILKQQYANIIDAINKANAAATQQATTAPAGGAATPPATAPK